MEKNKEGTTRSLHSHHLISRFTPLHHEDVRSVSNTPLTYPSPRLSNRQGAQIEPRPRRGIGR